MERDYIDGSMVGGLAAIFSLIDALGNGKKVRRFNTYLKKNFANVSLQQVDWKIPWQF